MKKFACLAAAAAFSIGTAHAAPVITYTYNPLVPDAFTAVFSDSPTTTTFADRFASFTITVAGYFTGSISSSGSTTNFVNVNIANLAGPVSGDGTTTPATRKSFNVQTVTYPTGGGKTATFQYGSLTSVYLVPGTYRIYVSGTTIGAKNTGSFSGTFNFLPAPEPPAWGLMILGFAGVGAGMRRRSSQRMRVAYN